MRRNMIFAILVGQAGLSMGSGCCKIRHSFHEVTGTSPMPFIARITLYPIKSLEGMVVTQAKVSPGGTLAYDREFALLGPDGKFVNGKGNAKVHRLRSVFDRETRTVALSIEGSRQSFHVEEDRAELEAWLSGFFGFPVRLVCNTLTGFPDDREAFGPTIISTATLAEVSSWFPGIDPDNLRLRLRANIEIGGVPAFWEDRLFNEPGTVVEFEVGAVRFAGVNPCQRCVVPSRDPFTGETYSGFQKTFANRRQETLPPWAARSRFNHYYRLSVNTRLSPSQVGKVISIGDEIKVIGIRTAVSL